MPQDILSKAQQLVDHDRREDYGPVDISFIRISYMWTAILGVPVTPQQVALCMLALKIAREVAEHKEDNLVDIIGYTLCLDKLYKEQSDAVEEAQKPLPSFNWLDKALKINESNPEGIVETAPQSVVEGRIENNI